MGRGGESFKVRFLTKCQEKSMIKPELNAVINNLSEDKQKEVFNFARFLLGSV